MQHIWCFHGKDSSIRSLRGILYIVFGIQNELKNKHLKKTILMFLSIWTMNKNIEENGCYFYVWMTIRKALTVNGNFISDEKVWSDWILAHYFQMTMILIKWTLKMNVLIDNECYFHVWVTKGTYSVVTPVIFWHQMDIKRFPIRLLMILDNTI